MLVKVWRVYGINLVHRLETTYTITISIIFSPRTRSFTWKKKKIEKKNKKVVSSKICTKPVCIYLVYSLVILLLLLHFSLRYIIIVIIPTRVLCCFIFLFFFLWENFTLENNNKIIEKSTVEILFWLHFYFLCLLIYVFLSLSKLLTTKVWFFIPCTNSSRRPNFFKILFSFERYFLPSGNIWAKKLFENEELKVIKLKKKIS